MAPVAYSTVHTYHGPPQPHAHGHTTDSNNTNQNQNYNPIHQPQPQAQHRQMAQQQALAALNGHHNHNQNYNHPHHILSTVSGGGSKRSSMVPLSKRGASSVADSVVPQHSHGHGGVNLNEHEAASLGLGLPRLDPLSRMKPRGGATLDDIARRVRAQSDRFQQAVLPAAEGIKTFAESSPVLFTFVAIFSSLSLVPLLIFIGFVTAIAVFSTGLAFIFLCFSVAGTVMFGLTFLIPILVVTTTISVFCVCALLALFLAHRLYLHLNEADGSGSGSVGDMFSAGVRTWWDETRSRVGLGPYRYRVMAFEDYKAYSSNSEMMPRGYDQAKAKDYSKQHPQPTPSQAGPRAVAIKIEREQSERELGADVDLFSPPVQQQLLPPAEMRSTDSVVKHEKDDDWSTDSSEVDKKR